MNPNIRQKELPMYLRSMLKLTAVTILTAVLTAVSATSAASAAALETLSLCGQCLNPSVSSKTGIGTSHAIAEARITREDAASWCSNWHPEDSNCLRGQLASDEAKKTYRAAANCSIGKITAIDGKSYTKMGNWATGVGKGRARFRDAGGNAVGQDEGSGGLAIAQQWEVLCPGNPKTALGGSPETGEGKMKRASATGGAGLFRANWVVGVPAVSASTVEGGAQAPTPNTCGTAPRCYDGGIFTAEVEQLIASQQPRANRIVRMNVRFHNVSNSPIILAYMAKSSSIIDNEGNQFYPASGGAVDTSVTGMGMVSAGSADTSFVLNPRETRNAGFQLFRKADKSIIGTSFSWTVSIAQLEVVGNGQQVRTVRQYSVNVSNMSPAGGLADPLGKLK
jgi:hypothetical protein